MPANLSERPPLRLPRGQAALLEHQLANGRYFGNRFPSYGEFVGFLQANQSWSFDERSFHQCSMSCCAGGPVGEGYSSDIDTNAPEWFREFERRTQSQQMWTGAELLPVIRAISSRMVKGG